MEPEDALFQSLHEKEAYAKGTATRVLNLLRDLEVDTQEKLTARIARLSESDKDNFIMGRSRGQYSTQRLERLLDAIREFSAEWRRITKENITLSAKEIAASEIELQEKFMALSGVLGEGISTTAAVSAAFSQPLLAQPLREYWAGVDAGVRRTVTRSIRNSFVAGETVEQTVNSLFGTGEFGDGELKTNRNSVRTLARTTLNHFSNVTARESLLALGATHYIYISVLDSRVSTICLSLSGSRWKLSNNNAPLPPMHPNCRSSIAYIESKDEALDGVQTSNMSAGKKLVSANLTYEDLLKRQPVAWQKQQFTALQYRLWKSGKVKLRGFSDLKSRRELTDGELRIKYKNILSQL